MAGRFAQARADGSYAPGYTVSPQSPAEMSAALSARMAQGAAGPMGAQMPAVLYGPDGKPLPDAAFRSQIDGGPGFPIQPRFTDPGMMPREWQFNPGWNLVPTPRGEGGMARFSDLRALAAACWQFRVAVNYRKNMIRGKRWEISPKNDKSSSARKASKQSIDAVTQFFQKPNRVDNVRFGEWIDSILEELLVVDAVALFKIPTKDGKEIHSLRQIDGATIKLIIDEFGSVVGYQQVLYGYPATQYPTHDPATGRAIIRDSGELNGRIVYVVTRPTVTNVYGTSTLEQLRPVIDLAIRRTLKQLSWYTNGTVPESMIETPEGYTPEQIRQMQEMFNELFSGNDAKRSMMTMLPHGANYVATKPFAFSKDESEEIISVICANEGIPRSIFTSQTNRATAEQQSDDASDSGQRPLEVTLKGFIDDVIESDLASFIPGAEDLEFTWVATLAGDELKIAQSKQLACGAPWRTVDEVRAEEGLDPMPENEKPAAKVAAVQQAMGGKKPEEQGKPGVPAPPADEAAQKAELATWEKFARKRVEKGKHTADFETTALPPRLVAFVAEGLAAATTDADVREVFAKAKAHAAAKKKSYEVQLSRVVAEALKRQHAGVLETAKKLLPEKAEAVA